MPRVSPQKAAEIFSEIDDRERALGGEHRFKANVYRNAAKLLQAGKIHSKKEAMEYPGIGKATADKIAQVLETGHSTKLDKLKEAGAEPKLGLRHKQSLKEKEPPRIATAHGAVTSLSRRRSDRAQREQLQHDPEYEREDKNTSPGNTGRRERVDRRLRRLEGGSYTRSGRKRYPKLPPGVHKKPGKKPEQSTAGDDAGADADADADADQAERSQSDTDASDSGESGPQAGRKRRAASEQAARSGKRSRSSSGGRAKKGRRTAKAAG